MAGRERRYSQRPQGAVEASSWALKRGLVALFDCANGREIISGQRASTNGTSPKTGRYGVAAAFSGTARQEYDHLPAYAVTGDLSIVALVEVSGTSTGRLISKGSLGSATPYYVRVNSTAASKLDIWRSGVSYLGDETGSTKLGDPFGGVIVYTAPAGASWNASDLIYVDGEVYTTTNQANGGGDKTPTDDGSPVLIGATVNNFPGNIYYVGLFNKVLSHVDKEYIRARPWVLYQAARDPNVFASAGGGGTVGLATETDTALGLAGVQIRGAGLAAETDTALALAGVSVRSAGLASETDSAFALAAKQITATGLAIESDTAFALAAGTPNGVGLAEETDTAFALAAKQIAATGLVTETDTALPLTVTVARQAGLAAENDSAFALAAVQKTAVGVAVETDSAFALGGGEAVASAGGGGDGDPAPRTRREPRRYVVRNGDELLVFTDEREAQAAQQAIDEWDARQAAKSGASAANEGKSVPKRRKASATLPAAIQPLEAIPLPDLRGLALGYGMQAIYDQAMSLRNLESAAALWQQLRDEEDEAEMLLLAA